MSPHQRRLASRRRFLKFLAASPLFAHGALAQGLRPQDPVDWAPRELDCFDKGSQKACCSRWLEAQPDVGLHS